jgi:hypothetical protein
MDKYWKDIVTRSFWILIASAILYWYMYNYQTKQKVVSADHFYQDKLASELAGVKELPYPGQDIQKKATVAQISSVVPAEEDIHSDFRAVDYETKKVSSDCFPKDRLTAEDLLPKDAANSKWAQVNPAGQGDLEDQNFLTAGFQIGVNTIGSSLRNANQQLRSEPVIPQSNPWPIMQSTIAPDTLRKPLEIGGDF